MCASALLGTGAGHAATEEVVVKPPQGAAKPVSGTGMGTQAALDDPRCNTAEAYSVYGRWDFSTVGTGPFCVRPFEDGEDNGGATSRGVTADAVKIVAVLPSDARSEAQKQSAPPQVSARTTPSTTWADMTHDYLYAYLPFHETWGRDLDVVLYTSTGIEEAAQRADATAILAEKPFAVINFDTYGLDTLVTTLAQSKTIVHSFAASPTETIAQAPYRWGGNDPDAASRERGGGDRQAARGQEGRVCGGRAPEHRPASSASSRSMT